MKAWRWALLVLAAALVPNAARPDVGPDQAAAVDLTPALKIGDFTTSRYLFAKAYNQFIASGAQRRGRGPSPEETGNWFRLYLAQQVILAHLVEQKQLNRPEVVEITERMTRYMLTQPNGPLYRALGGTDRIAFRRERRALILRVSQYSAFPRSIAQLWAAIGPGLGQGTAPREADVAAIGSSVMANYVSAGVAKQISARDFVQDFRQGIARMAPRDPKSLGEQIEDMVVAEYDLAKARKLGLDQTPQFLEDRKNFALHQALARYEQEILAPRAGITPGEPEAYYQNHLDRYSSPAEIRGTLYTFPDELSAREGLTALTNKEAPGAALKAGDPLIVRRDGPSLLPQLPYQGLVALGDGQWIGPFAQAGHHAIFVKQGAGSQAPVPFAQVQDRVRHELSREKLDALELEYLARNSDRVLVLLDLAEYNIENPLLHPRAE